MGYGVKEEKTKRVPLIPNPSNQTKRVIVIKRGIKTLFFLITLLISFLFFSAPLLLAIADTILASALLLSPHSSLSLSSHFRHYNFRSSVIDIPFVSFLRSLLILCVYSCCDGPRLSRGPYLWVATVCSVVSVVFVSFKAPFVFGGGGGCAKVTEVVMFVSSYALAVGHVAVAYRISCRERKKLLVFKIDIEAVNSACKKGYPRYENKKGTNEKCTK